MSELHSYIGYRKRKCRCEVCVTDNARYVKEYRSRRREVFQANYIKRQRVIDEIKLTAGCIDCSYRGHPGALDFDHVRGEKKFIISRSSLHSLKLVEEELKKCEVVCANCHRIRTIERRRASK